MEIESRGVGARDTAKYQGIASLQVTDRVRVNPCFSFVKGLVNLERVARMVCCVSVDCELAQAMLCLLRSSQGQGEH